MNSIPTQLENPRGLHGRYYIQKIVVANGPFDDGDEMLKLAPVDEGAEYFVMRLDDGGKDPVHIDACRKAVLYYAELIKDHLPQLSADLIERYAPMDAAQQKQQGEEPAGKNCSHSFCTFPKCGCAPQQWPDFVKQSTHPPVDQQRWISVETVLPQTGVKVKCKLSEDIGMGITEKVLYRQKNNGQWNDYHRLVVAWQPILPTAPSAKEAEQDKNDKV